MAKTKRIFSEDLMIESDTFKLEVSKYSKNLSFDTKNPVLVGVEHCHFFHTFDSSGKKLDVSNHVAGHTHKIIVKESKDGTLTAICSEPEPSFYGDKHTHEVTYLKSDRFKVRQLNQDAMKVLAGIDNVSN